jgi:iron only hydrogenase large subunit-like protein
MQVNGLPNIDAVLTTRELIRMIQEAGVDLLIQEESEFDQPFAQGSAQAEKSGIPGGFMEAVLQSLYEKVTKRSLSSEMPKAVPVPEYEQIKEIELKIENPIETYRFLQGAVIKAAVASGLRGAQILMDQTAKGESPYHFIDIMACPDGCVGGGGQPGPLTPEKVRTRCQALNRQSERKSSRHANDNTDIIKLYEDFLQEPNSSKAVELIHARYTK